MDIAVSNEAINGHEQAAHRQLRQVAPDELHAFWPMVRSGIEKVAARSSDGWLPEDVYMALRQGTSTLLVGFVESYYVGFVVVTPQPGWQGPQANLWAVYHRGARDMLETFLADLLDILRARGFVRLTMSSLRDGWEKRAAQLGFERGVTHFAREI